MNKIVLTQKRTGKELEFRSIKAAMKYVGASYEALYHAYMTKTAIRVKGKSTGILVNVGLEWPKHDGLTRVQLCMDCKKFARGCSWSERFEPVEGWEAEPTTIGRGQSSTTSYRIISCPLFEEG